MPVQEASNGHLFDFLKLIVRSHSNRLVEAILMNTHNMPFINIKKTITLNYPNLQLLEFFQGTQEQVRNNHDNRVISVRVTEGLL